MELIDVSKSYNGRVVLDKLSLNLPDGEITHISGPSGRGKTTLLRLLMGLEVPDSGEVIVKAGASMSAVFQEDRLPPDFSALRCLMMTAPRGTALEAARRELAALGLGDCENQPVRELSGGMRRRVCIARAMLVGAEVIFLDEPFTGLDPDNRRLAAEYIKARRGAATVIAVSHEQEDAALIGAALRVAL